MGKPRQSAVILAAQLAAALSLAVAPMATPRAQVVEDIEDEFEFEEPEIEEPEIEEPEVAEPEVEEPEVEEPEVAEPEVAEPEAEEPEVEAPEAEEVDSEDVEVAGELGEEDGADEHDEGGDDESASSSDEDASATDDSLTADLSAADIMFGEEWLSDLAQSQDPEFDHDGNPVRRGEVVALDLSAEGQAALLNHGFLAIESSELASLDAQLTTFAAPVGQSAEAALVLARSLDPAGIFDLGHFYASNYQPSTGRQARSAQPVSSHGIAGNLRIGLVDTEVRRADLPSRVTVESRAFGQVGAAGNSDHGTAVAAILAANGARELVAANVFDNDGQLEFTSAQTIGAALAWLLERQVDVVNISLAGPRNAVLDALVHRAAVRGTVIVAAAGNGGPTAPPAYPAALPDVVAVTAVDSTRRIYRYANRGPYVRLATYGVRVLVPLGERGTVQFTGTSYAAPRIAARIAACIATGVVAQSCIQRLERSAEDLGGAGRDDIYGFGMIE